jgi:hypothetical protein
LRFCCLSFRLYFPLPPGLTTRAAVDQNHRHSIYSNFHRGEHILTCKPRRFPFVTIAILPLHSRVHTLRSIGSQLILTGQRHVFNSSNSLAAAVHVYMCSLFLTLIVRTVGNFPFNLAPQYGSNKYLSQCLCFVVSKEQRQKISAAISTPVHTTTEQYIYT